jgi:hypothetical protein
MSIWISVNDFLPEPTSRGINDAFPVLIFTKEPYGRRSPWNIKACTWINNHFEGYPAGAKNVTHWMPVPELPDQDQDQES